MNRRIMGALCLCALLAAHVGALRAVGTVPENALSFENCRLESAEGLPDGGYLLVGCTQKPGTDDASATENYWAWAARVDAQGKVLWETSYEGGGSFVAAVRLADGTFLLGMEYEHQDFYNLALVVLDDTGRVQGDPISLENGGFFSKGAGCLLLEERSESDGRGATQAIRALGAHGEVLWRQEYPSLTGSGVFIAPAPDGYLLAGSIQDYPYDQTLENTYAFGAKLDKAGNLLWQNQVSEDPGSGIQALVPLPDGGLAGVGSHLWAHGEDGRPMNTVYRFGGDGAVEWFQVYSLPSFGEGVFFEGVWLQPDGNLLVMGSDRSGGRLQLYQMDPEGNPIQEWTQALISEGRGMRSRCFTAGDTLYFATFFRADGDDITSPYTTTVMPIMLP